MASDKEKQLDEMFALRDCMFKSETPKTEEYETEDVSVDQDKPEMVSEKVEASEEPDPWDEAEDNSKKKRKLSGLPYLFPKDEESEPKSVNPITTEEDDEDDEYGKTKLLVEDEPKSLGYKLVVLESGQECVIKNPVFLIGCQKNACDLVIPQDVKNHVVSRKHAYILIKNDKAYVKDISSNGTYIGTEGMKDNEFYRLPKDTEVELKDRQVIKLANIKLMFSFDK